MNTDKGRLDIEDRVRRTRKCLIGGLEEQERMRQQQY